MEAAEKQHDGQERTGLGLGRLLWMFAVLAVLYVLSTGPVIKVCLKRGSARIPRGIEVFYKPLEFSYEHLPLSKRFFDWYFHVWRIK